MSLNKLAAAIAVPILAAGSLTGVGVATAPAALAAAPSAARALVVAIPLDRCYNPETDQHAYGTGIVACPAGWQQENSGSYVAPIQEGAASVPLYAYTRDRLTVLSTGSNPMTGWGWTSEILGYTSATKVADGVAVLRAFVREDGADNIVDIIYTSSTDEIHKLSRGDSLYKYSGEVANVFTAPIEL